MSDWDSAEIRRHREIDLVGSQTTSDLNLLPIYPTTVMASTHHHSRYTAPQQQNQQNERRLPSIKDLNFQYRSPQGGVAQPEQPTQEYPTNTPRHSSAWGARSVPISTQAVQQHHQQQHTPPLSAGHDVTKEVEYPSKQENGGYVHPGIPLSAQVTPLPGAVNIGNPRSDDSPHSPNQLKRSRTASTNVPVPRDIRQSHTYAQPQYASYPPTSQPPTSNSYTPIPSGLPGQPSHGAHPPSHDQMQHHPMAVSAHPGYAPYQHAYLQARQPVMHPQHSSQPTHSNPYPSPGPPPPAPPPQGPWGQTHPQQQHPPQPTSHQLPPPQQQHAQQPPHYQQQPSAPSHMVQHHHNQPPHQNTHPPIQHHSLQQQQPPPQQQQQQFQPQQQQLPFARTTAIVPTTVDTRDPYAVNEPNRQPLTAPLTRNDTLMEIAHRCLVLHQFASRYAQQPHVQPSPGEWEDMSQHALAVVRLLEELQRMDFPEDDGTRVDSNPMHQSPDDPRPPKRPWEDISQEEGAPMSDPNSFADQYASAESKPQTTAEQDMELIRTKRATSSAGANSSTGQPKSKYRKRSRATPPGKCHSCNIRETPEWRRGPDGARTLCNACGLHYAKLMRKRDKNGANGEVPHIDLETLRASARAADIATAEKAHSRKQGSRSQQSEPVSPMNVVKQPPQHHEGSFQLVNMASDPSSSTMPTDTSRVPPPTLAQQQQQQSMTQSSSAPWSTNAVPPPTAARTYAQPDHNNIQQQSFMRSSQQHPSINHAPR